MTGSSEHKLVEVANRLLSNGISHESAADEISKVGDVPPSCRDLLHFLHHYLADEDIRSRDGEYADFQRTRLRELVRAAT